jgi:hypothetical protein
MMVRLIRLVMTPLAKANGFSGPMQVYNPALSPDGSIRAGPTEQNLFCLPPSGKRLQRLIFCDPKGVSVGKQYTARRAAIPLSAEADSPLAA